MISNRSGGSAATSRLKSSNVAAAISIACEEKNKKPSLATLARLLLMLMSPMLKMLLLLLRLPVVCHQLHTHPYNLKQPFPVAILRSAESTCRFPLWCQKISFHTRNADRPKLTVVVQINVGYISSSPWLIHPPFSCALLLLLPAMHQQ